jgi:hypothetical protein
MIRLFVGSIGNRSNELRLLDSISEKCSGEIKVTWLRKNSLLTDGWISSGWQTPIEGFKFMIPELCGFHDRAIYLEADYVVKDDLNKLFGIVGDEIGWCPVLGYQQKVVVVNNCFFQRSWWMEIDWMKSSGWTEYEYIRHIRSHNQLKFGINPEWYPPLPPVQRQNPI